jgi:hypothetical protein
MEEARSLRNILHADSSLNFRTGVLSLQGNVGLRDYQIWERSDLTAITDAECTMDMPLLDQNDAPP